MWMAKEGGREEIKAKDGECVGERRGGARARERERARARARAGGGGERTERTGLSSETDRGKDKSEKEGERAAERLSAVGSGAEKNREKHGNSPRQILSQARPFLLFPARVDILKDLYAPRFACVVCVLCVCARARTWAGEAPLPRLATTSPRPHPRPRCLRGLPSG